MQAHPRLAFVHTAALHVTGFQAQLDALAPGTPVEHHVDESLLAEARRVGLQDTALRERVQQAMHAAAASGAAVVVCTCSTVGGLAEATPTQGRFIAQRIDRAMADQAVQRGPAVLVLAALDSTLAPTAALIEDSARRLGRPVQIRTQLIAGAWARFEAGDLPGYHATIAAAIAAAPCALPPGPGVRVLAQASMAGALALLDPAEAPPLSSPGLGVLAALAAAGVPTR